MANLVPLFIDKDTGKIIASTDGVIGGGPGPGGGDCDHCLVWSGVGNSRVLTGYIDNNGVLHPVRSAEFNGNDLLELEFATFSPIVSGSPLPMASLNWDMPATGFNVSVTNPTDYTSEYISSVLSITALTGSIDPLANFTAGTKTPTPAGGVSWTQQFTDGVNGHIRPVSSTIVGGNVSGVVNFNYTNSSGEFPYTGGTAAINISWATPTMTVSLGSLSGQTFLSSYSSVPYTIGVTGVTNVASVCSHDVTATGGSVNNPTSSGTFTFTTPIHKNNITSTTRSVNCTTTFTRPASVTGTSYTAQLSTAASITSASFTYPSFYIWTPSVIVVPTVGDIVNGTGFAVGVTQLGDQVRTFAGFVTNSSVDPRAWWFAVRTSAIQPTVFKTGASPSLLSDVAVTMGNTVILEPTPLPSGYTPVSYTLYGIILQPGNTYVSIS